MKRYWTAVLKDSSVAVEGHEKWDDIKDSVEQLSLHFDGRWYSLPSGMGEYIQAKTVSCPLGGGDVAIESRYIGFRNDNIEYILRVIEENGDCQIELKEGSE